MFSQELLHNLPALLFLGGLMFSLNRFKRELKLRLCCR